jgi:hypothetical protein
MGWRQLCAWQRAMIRSQQGDEPDPDRWTDASNANFDELRAKRDQLRGR